MFDRVFPTHALTLSQVRYCTKRNLIRVRTQSGGFELTELTYTHSGGFELTKLTYTRLEDIALYTTGGVGDTKPFTPVVCSGVTLEYYHY